MATINILLKIQLISLRKSGTKILEKLHTAPNNSYSQIHPHHKIYMVIIITIYAIGVLQNKKNIDHENSNIEFSTFKFGNHENYAITVHDA